MRTTRAIGENGLLAMVCSALMALQPVFGAPTVSIMATVNSGGQIEVNGIAAPAGTIIYAGNRIETSTGGNGYLALARGGRLVLGRSTTAQVDEAGKNSLVRLASGVVAAVSEAGAPIVVTTDGATIRAKLAAGTFEVVVNGSSLKVLARHGAAMVKAGNRTVEIPEGEMMDATVDSSSGQSGHSKHKLLIGGLIAAGVVGVGLGVGLAETGNSCVSTSQLRCQ